MTMALIVWLFSRFFCMSRWPIPRQRVPPICPVRRSKSFPNESETTNHAAELEDFLSSRSGILHVDRLYLLFFFFFSEEFSIFLEVRDNEERSTARWKFLRLPFYWSLRVCQYCVQNLLARKSESSVNILSSFCLVRYIIRVNGKDLW